MINTYTLNSQQLRKAIMGVKPESQDITITSSPPIASYNEASKVAKAITGILSKTNHSIEELRIDGWSFYPSRKHGRELAAQVREEFENGSVVTASRLLACLEATRLWLKNVGQHGSLQRESRYKERMARAMAYIYRNESIGDAPPINKIDLLEAIEYTLTHIPRND